MSKHPSSRPIPPQAPDPFVRLAVRVQPKASRNRLAVELDGSLRIWVTAPPVDGSANRAVCDFLASALGVSRSSVTVEKGSHSREKLVAVRGGDRHIIQERLQSLVSSSA